MFRNNNLALVAAVQHGRMTDTGLLTDLLWKGWMALLWLIARAGGGEVHSFWILGWWWGSSLCVSRTISYILSEELQKIW